MIHENLKEKIYFTKTTQYLTDSHWNAPWKPTCFEKINKCVIRYLFLQMNRNPLIDTSFNLPCWRPGEQHCCAQVIFYSLDHQLIHWLIILALSFFVIVQIGIRRNYSTLLHFDVSSFIVFVWEMLLSPNEIKVNHEYYFWHLKKVKNTGLD